MNISDITAAVYRRTRTDSTKFPASDMLIQINAAYNHVVSLIIQADSKWQWDDSNQTDLPIATTALVSGQADYSLAVGHLTIERVELLPNGANTTTGWIELTQLDQQDLKRDRKTALTSYKSTTGTPAEYDISGLSILLYPIPNYSQAASLRVYFTRGPAEFTSAEVSTGTKQPGFAGLFHDLIPLWVSYEYAIEKGLPTAQGFWAEILQKQDILNRFYGLRNRDKRAGLTTTTDSNK